MDDLENIKVPFLRTLPLDGLWTLVKTDPETGRRYYRNEWSQRVVMTYSVDEEIRLVRHELKNFERLVEFALEDVQRAKDAKDAHPDRKFSRRYQNAIDKAQDELRTHQQDAQRARDKLKVLLAGSAE